MSLSGHGATGRARSAFAETEPARGRERYRSRPQPEPVDRPDLLNWESPRTKTVLINMLMAKQGPLAFLTRRAAMVLVVLIHRRNPTTGQLDPSWLNLGAGARYKDRSVAYGLAELRRHDLIASERRCYGLTPTSAAYVLTCKLLILARIVKDHAPDTCENCRSAAAMAATRRPHNLQTNPDLRSHSGSSASAPPSRSKKEREPAHGQADLRVPFSKDPRPRADLDPTRTAFVAVFERERHALYGDNQHGSIGDENRAKLSVFLADFVGCAWAWTQQQGLARVRADVANELFEGLVRAWLASPGTNGFLRDRRHPLGLLVGDLDEFGAIAREVWERTQANLKPVQQDIAPEGAISAKEHADQLEAEARDAWPPLVEGEPDADELAELARLAELADLARAETHQQGHLRLVPELTEHEGEEHPWRHLQVVEEVCEIEPVEPSSSFSRRASDRFARLDTTVGHLRALLAKAWPTTSTRRGSATTDPSAVPAPLPLTATTRFEERYLHPGEGRLPLLDFSGEIQQRSDRILDHDPGRPDRADDGVHHEVRSRHVDPAGLGRGGGARDGRIEGGEPGIAEADRDAMDRDRAPIGLSGSAHEGTVPRGFDEQEGGGFCGTRTLSPGEGAGILVVRIPPPPSAESSVEKREDHAPEAAKGAGFFVAQEPSDQALRRSVGRSCEALDQPFLGVDLELEGTEATTVFVARQPTAPSARSAVREREDHDPEATEGAVVFVARETASHSARSAIRRPDEHLADATEDAVFVARELAERAAPPPTSAPEPPRRSPHAPPPILEAQRLLDVTPRGPVLTLLPAYVAPEFEAPAVDFTDDDDCAAALSPDVVLAKNDTGDDPQFFARLVARARQEVAVLAELEAEQRANDPDFFARQMDRAGQEVAFLAELEAEQCADALPPTLGPGELGLEVRGPAEAPTDEIDGAGPRQPLERPRGAIDEGDEAHVGDLERLELGAAERDGPDEPRLV